MITTTYRMPTQISGKKIQQLVDEGILPCRQHEIPVPGHPDRDAYEEIIRSTDAYQKYLSMMLKKPLVGSEKQIAWATDIRLRKAQDWAFRMVVTLHITKISEDNIDFNKWGKEILKQFASNSASYYIENRHS